jgi:hypothetical protein
MPRTDCLRSDHAQRNSRPLTGCQDSFPAPAPAGPGHRKDGPELLPLRRGQAVSVAVPEMVAKKTGSHEVPVNKP